MNVVFTAALFVGSGAIACWITVRFPRFAPRSLMWRGVGALVMVQAVSFVPVASGSYLALYGTVFAVLLPVLTVMWLLTLWLLQGLRDFAGM